MRRRVIISVAVVLVLALGYEIAFRCVAANCGEVNMKAHPPRVYFSDDLLSSVPWRGALFGFRTLLPFGKVRLCPKLYVSGGRFYGRLPDGGWQDLTDTMVEYQKAKNEK
jgi:hypothetical protein